MDADGRVVIVGGGMSGLAAAHYLTRHAPHLDTVLVEKEQRLGGKIVTQREGGFVIEGGPDSFLSSKPRGIGLAAELGMEHRLEGTNEAFRRTYVMFDGELHPLPEGLSGLVPSRLEPLLESRLFSHAAKERLGREPSIPARPEGGDESLAAFMERRFGREVYERMIEPLMSGIYAGDGTQLSLEATFPQLRRMEVRWGSLVAGMRGAQRERGATPSALPSFLTPVGGMGELVEAVRRTLPANATRTGMFARKIERTAAGYRVELHDGAALEAGAVIVATPAQIAAELTAGLDADLSADLGAIPHVSSATVSLGYARAAIPRPLDGYGYIVPRREGRPVLAMTWTSSKFAHRAPEGFGLIRVFLAGAGREAILAGTDDHLVEAARHEARETLGITAEPAARRVFRWPLGMPQYVLGHLERVARIEGRAGAHAGLFLAGNAFRGVGIPDCIASGEAAAARAIERQAAGGSRRALGALEPRGSR